MLPWAYDRVGVYNLVQSGGALPPEDSAATLPNVDLGTVFRQADPDWPEFDRFARPSRLNVPSYDSFDVELDTVDFSGPNPMNTQTTVQRARLLKPDRHIERAWYFIGAPEIDPFPLSTPPGFTGSGRPTTYQIPTRRNVIQPGLLIPDLSYHHELDGLPGSGIQSSAIQDQVVIDYDRDATGPATRRIAAPSGLEFPDATSMVVHGNRFVATDRFDADRDLGLLAGDTLLANVPQVAESLPIAPILPGRYAVIGPSSNAFEIADQSNDLSGLHGRAFADYRDDATTLENRHATVLSHRFYSSGENPEWNRFRRIELIPSSNPDRHQAVVRFNGWASPLRSSEVIPLDPAFADFTARPVDITRLTNVTELPDPRAFELGQASEFTLDGDPRLIQPAVAIPMDGFNISEPLDGYHMRRNEIYQAGPGGAVRVRVAPSVENPDGQTIPATEQLASATLVGFDQPLDVLDELGAVRQTGGGVEEQDQTTPAYRTLHLQRLANPLLAWNPAPLRPGPAALRQTGPGPPPPALSVEPVAEHDPSRPVNPYLTVDSLPLDLIAYNGAVDPMTRRPGATTRPLATSERGIASGLTPIADPNAPVLASTAAPPGPPGLPPPPPEPTYATIETADLTPRDLWRAVTGLVINNEPDFKLGVIATNHPDTDVFAASSGGPPGVGGGAIGVVESPYDAVLQHSLGFANRGFGDLISDNVGGVNVAQVDLNGDGNLDPVGNVRIGELVGTPEIDQSDDNPADAQTFANNDAPPALHWPNRPFVSAGELTLVPMWSSSRLLTHYSTFNASLADQRNPYDGDLVLGEIPDPSVPGPNPPRIVARLSPDRLDEADPRLTNRFRWRNERAPFGHLLPFFATATEPARALPWSRPDDPSTPDEDEEDLSDTDVIAYGAPHYYRILDYVHTPSRFVETDTLLNPRVFGQLPPTLDDPRIGLTAPFNRVDHYREPGRVNLNTVGTRRDTIETPSSGPRADRPADLWSEVYDGLMHRREDFSALADLDNDDVLDTLAQLGHLGPAWRDVVVSRRGYIQPTYVDGPTSGVDYSPGLLHPDFPTLYANPLRSPDGGDNVPLTELRHGGVDAMMLRTHVFSPGEDGAWGARQIDDRVVDKDSPANVPANRDLVRDDAGEAGVNLTLDLSVDVNGDGRADGDIPLVRRDPLTGIANTIPDSLDSSGALPPQATPTPMFSGASTEPALNTERNPQLRYGPISRLTNLTTARSGVFAVWITVGYFEVTPANENPAIWPRYMVDNNGDGVGDEFIRPASDPNSIERLFFRVYHDGMTLGEEIDLDIGENRRMRGFYLIDRTLPVAFKPGDDVNVEDAILLRRRIE